MMKDEGRQEDPSHDVDSQGEPTRTDVLDDLTFFEFTHTESGSCGADTVVRLPTASKPATAFSNYTVVGQECPTHIQRCCQWIAQFVHQRSPRRLNLRNRSGWKFF